MTFYERLDAVVDLLRRRGRVSYRALVREFDFDDAFLADLKTELIEVQKVAADEDGKMLVWVGGSAPASAAVQPSGGAPLAPGPSPAERRQVTVMFCDLVASTELAARLDPEELREVLRAYQDVANEVVRRLGGVIARYIGDGLKIYFGYPLAHEDDPQRAVRAGLEIVDGVRQLQSRLETTSTVLATTPLRVRVGLHTGLAVMGSMGDPERRDEMESVGETPNIAARIQNLAAPDTVVVSDATRRLLKDTFVCEPLGAHVLKGITDPVTVHRVVAEADTRDVPSPTAPMRLNPLVGREQELGLLADRWAQVTEGFGQVVLVTGEPGIGKSRLVRLLETDAPAAARLVLKARCSPQHEHSALYPVGELLRRVIRDDREAPNDDRLRRLEQTVQGSGRPASALVPVLAPLLGISIPHDRYPPLGLNPDRARRRTLGAVVEVVLELAAREPVLLLVEDLQWVDPSTLEWLGLLVEQTPTARLLVVLTARPGFTAPWATREHITRLTLGRLRRAHIQALIASVTGGKALPAAVLEEVVAKTDGVPLFVEELTKMIVESGLLREDADRYELVGALPPVAIPATLQDSLMARLDRLATVKNVAQIGAVVGRTFSYALLRTVSGFDDETLERELTKLVDAELLHQRGIAPAATYTFKHALIQDAAYQTLLKSTRQQYHRAIARALEAERPESAHPEPEIIARHYTEAGLAAEAVPYWTRAAHDAAARSAYLEAIAHFRAALGLVEALPDHRHRARIALDLWIGLGQSLLAAKGHTATEVERAFARARELSSQVAEVGASVPALLGLFQFYLTRAEFPKVRELGPDLVALAQKTADPVHAVMAQLTAACLAFHLADVAAIRAYLESRDRSGVHASSPDFIALHRERAIYCQSYDAAIVWLLGRPDLALQTAREARALAEASAHPFSRTIALVHGAYVHQFRREPGAVAELAEAAVALSLEHDFRLYAATAKTMVGWGLAKRGHLKDGIALIRDGLAGERALGINLRRPYFLSLLADALGDAGEVVDALATLDEALALADATGERWWEPEQLRLKGVLLQRQTVPDRAGAETCFLRALDVARARQARSLELRAATSLARLWQELDRPREARGVLADIYGRFTEGLDAPDLVDARAVLANLG